MNSDLTVPADDRLLQAVRFVCGEMTADEAEAFDSRLETDDALCRAVAEAAAISDALIVSKVSVKATPDGDSSDVVTGRAERHRVVSRPADVRTSGGSRTGALAVTACSLLTAVVGWLLISRTGTDATNLAAAGPSAVESVDELQPVLLSFWEDSDLSPSDSDGSEDVVADEEFDVPEWMLSALVLAESEPGDAGGSVDDEEDGELF